MIAVADDFVGYSRFFAQQRQWRDVELQNWSSEVHFEVTRLVNFIYWSVSNRAL